LTVLTVSNSLKPILCWNIQNPNIRRYSYYCSH
jgi:hypothetical protein